MGTGQYKEYNEIYKYMRRRRAAVISQKFQEDGVLVEFSDGHQEKFKYIKNEDGEEGVEMCPNWIVSIDVGR